MSLCLKHYPPDLLQFLSSPTEKQAGQLGHYPGELYFTRHWFSPPPLQSMVIIHAQYTISHNTRFSEKVSTHAGNEAQPSATKSNESASLLKINKYFKISLNVPRHFPSCYNNACQTLTRRC